MKFHVSREACCSQDDQLGPLMFVYELSADASLQDFTDAVMKSRFLQFTSTHAVMVGELGDDALVRVFSPYAEQPQRPQYLKPANLLVRDLIGPAELRFRFEFDVKG